jgi:hypothetical protein
MGHQPALSRNTFTPGYGHYIREACQEREAMERERVDAG